MVRLVLLLTTGVIALLGALVVVTAAADIDNVIGWRTTRDLGLLKSTQVGGVTIGELVGKSLRVQKWRAYHAGDELYRTVVDCYVVTHLGEQQILSWEIAHNFSPHPAIPRVKVFVCALTREAAELTPALMPGGLRIQDYPRTEFRVLSSSALLMYPAGQNSRRLSKP